MLTDPTPDEESREIRAVVRRFLADRVPVDRVRAHAATPAGYDPDDWRQMVELGWTALALPDAGFGAVAQCVLLEEFGRSLAGGPMLATTGLALPALLACADPAATELVEGIVEGRVVAFARGPLTARDGSAHGQLDLVLDAQNADTLLVATQVDGAPALVAVATADAAVEPVEVVDATRRFATVRLDGTPTRQLNLISAERMASAGDVQAVHLAAQMIGGATRALELTVEYLGTRRQFGKPLGSFQALKHRCADAAVTVTLARELVYAAAGLVDAQAWPDLHVAARAALARAATTYQSVTAEAIQLHGGIGFTDEHDIGLYYRRALVDRDLCGTPPDVREELAVAVGL